MKNIAILGSTGSIGRNTLQVIAMHPDKFCVYALTAYSNADLLLAQCAIFKPKLVVLHHIAAANKLTAQLRDAAIDCEVLSGESGLIAAATANEVDFVMAAIVGAAGLVPTLMAAYAGKRILLANKETLVMAGSLFIQAVHAYKAELVPIDSEHNAIFQCLPLGFVVGQTNQTTGIRKITLTASGGPLLTTPLEKLAQVSTKQACAHPRWNMGPKISVDSATMMNKALEVIEAHYLFGLAATDIEVLIHPQSIIHSMVDYVDGSVLAVMANPDMRIPIAHALAWPERISSGVSNLNLLNTRLDFVELDPKRFPCVALAYQVLAEQGTSGVILNAANEVAVTAFLAQRIAFTDIYPIIVATLMKVTKHSTLSLEQILQDDATARLVANNHLETL